MQAEDLPFLYEVYFHTRIDELAPLDWTPEQIDEFVQMQFKAQHSFYQEHYATASFDIILLDAQPIGRLYVDRWEEEIRIIDIALLPAYRNRGIGGVLVQDLLDEAAAANHALSIHVEQFTRPTPL